MTWVPITGGSVSWQAIEESNGGWVDPNLTPLLTEDGRLLLTERGDVLCIEASIAPPPSPWVPL